MIRIAGHVRPLARTSRSLLFAGRGSLPRLADQHLLPQRNVPRRQCSTHSEKAQKAKKPIIHEFPDPSPGAWSERAKVHNTEAERRLWEASAAEGLHERMVALEETLSQTLGVFKNLGNYSNIGGMKLVASEYGTGIPMQIKLIAGSVVLLVCWYYYNQKEDLVTERIGDRTAKVVAQTLQDEQLVTQSTALLVQVSGSKYL